MRETFLIRPDRPALPRRALTAWAALAAVAGGAGLALSSGWVGSDSRAGLGAQQVESDGSGAEVEPATALCPRILGLPNTACLAHARNGAGGEGGSAISPSASGSGPSQSGTGTTATGDSGGSPPSAGPSAPAGSSPGSTAGPPKPASGPATTAGAPAAGTATTKPAATGSSPATTAPPAQVAPLPPDIIEQVCSIIRAAGAAPARRGTDLYAPELDPDGNGLACE